MQDKFEDLALTGCPTRRLASLTERAHRAATLTQITLIADGDSAPQLLAEAAPRADSCMRNGRPQAAAQYAEAVPLLHKMVTDQDIPGLLAFYGKQTEEHIVLETSSLESSPETQGRAPLPVSQATTLYRQDGSACLTHDEVGAELVAKRAPVFTPRPPAHTAMRIFLPHTQPSGRPHEWSWIRGTPRDIASHARDGTLGMDGLGYSFWLHSPYDCLDVLDDIVERAQEGARLPLARHASRTYCLDS